MPGRGLLAFVRPVALAVLVLALTSPGAAAQNGPVPATMIANLEDPGPIFEPGQNATMDLRLIYKPPVGAPPAPAVDGYDPTASGFAPTRITFTLVQVPSWIDNVTFVPEVALANLSGPSAGSGDVPLSVRVIVHVRSDAPAGLREPMIVAAHAEENGAIGAADATTPEITIRPGLVPRVQVEPLSNPAVVPGGRAFPVTFRVTNVGNGELTAKLNVTLKPESSLVEFPPTVTLAANASTTVDVLLTLPWTFGEFGELTLEAIPVAGDEEGKPVEGTVQIEGQSAIPGAGAWALLGVLGAAALLRRR